jgi:hypothetical protein
VDIIKKYSITASATLVDLVASVFHSFPLYEFIHPKIREIENGYYTKMCKNENFPFRAFASFLDKLLKNIQSDLSQIKWLEDNSKYIQTSGIISSLNKIIEEKKPIFDPWSMKLIQFYANYKWIQEHIIIKKNEAYAMGSHQSLGKQSVLRDMPLDVTMQILRPEAPENSHPISDWIQNYGIYYLHNEFPDYCVDSPDPVNPKHPLVPASLSSSFCPNCQILRVPYQNMRYLNE